MILRGAMPNINLDQRFQGDGTKLKLALCRPDGTRIELDTLFFSGPSLCICAFLSVTATSGHVRSKLKS